MRSRRAAGQGLGFLADDAAERAVYVISVAAELAGMHRRRCASTTASAWSPRPAPPGTGAATPTATSSACAASRP